MYQIIKNRNFGLSIVLNCAYKKR